MGENVVAILGGRGMLGTDVAEECSRRCISHQVFDLPEFDITDKRQLENVVAGASAIVNCVAYTNVDGAESEYDLAYRVNAEAVGNLGQSAGKYEKWVLHISTDFVFDGRLNQPYVETDEPNPIGKYGKSKLAGEELLIESGCRCCIMRVEWTYGLHGRNFVTKLLERTKKSRELKVVDDQIGSPTATTEAAKAVCQVILKRPEGLFHFASEGYVSRFEMARFIFNKKGVAVDLQPCKTSDYVSPAARPLNSCFNCDKIKAILDEPIEHWEGPLERFLRRL
jgi:dTDP-4-dehydrorhamnose reductase